MSLLAQLLMPKGAGTSGGGAPAPTAATPPPTSADPNQQALAAMLSGVQSPEPHTTPMPQTTFPEVPRAQNPAFSQMLMQAMMGVQGQAPQSNLGALLRGGM